MSSTPGESHSPATMTDVARLAGVSQSTVSHVINKSRAVSAATAAAVQRAIEATGYVHDDIARSLRTGSTRTIGLAVSAISNPYFADAVRAIEDHVRANGYSLMLVDTHDDPEEERTAVARVLSRRPDGLILAPSHHELGAVTSARRRGVATVLIDRIPEQAEALGLDAVGVENRAPMRDLTRVLIDAGHRRVLYIAPKSGLTTTTEREAGFFDAIASAPHHVDARVIEPEADLTARLAPLLTGPDGFTAIATGNNSLTIRTMRALSELGLSAPTDVSLVCFDDFEWSDLFHPRLTTVRQPISELGETASRYLLERLGGYDGPPRITRLSPQLIQRDSVATR